MTLPISAKQMEVLNAFRAFAEEHGRTPSVRELAKLLGRAPSTIHQFLTTLEERGIFVNDEGAHGWRIAEADAAPPARAAAPDVRPEVVLVPLLGRIAAGRPIEAVADGSESVAVARSIAREGTFALRVRGNSMIDDHVLDGDLVLIQPQDSVDDGDIAVALLDDGGATLKRIYRETSGAHGGKIRLQPANAEMLPMYVDHITIQGKVVGLIRDLR